MKDEVSIKKIKSWVKKKKCECKANHAAGLIQLIHYNKNEKKKLHELYGEYGTSAESVLDDLLKFIKEQE